MCCFIFRLIHREQGETFSTDIVTDWAMVLSTVILIVLVKTSKSNTLEQAVQV